MLLTFTTIYSWYIGGIGVKYTTINQCSHQRRTQNFCEIISAINDTISYIALLLEVLSVFFYPLCSFTPVTCHMYNVQKM